MNARIILVSLVVSMSGAALMPSAARADEVSYSKIIAQTSGELSKLLGWPIKVTIDQQSCDKMKLDDGGTSKVEHERILASIKHTYSTGDEGIGNGTGVQGFKEMMQYDIAKKILPVIFKELHVYC